MAWTAPMTFADGTALTAAQLNAHLRDNMLETMTAKATTPGGMFWGTDTNAIVERVPLTARVTTRETTTSGTYVDLATPGPSVTIQHGTTVAVFIAAEIGNNTLNAQTVMSYNTSGDNTIGSAASWGIVMDGIAAATDANYINGAMFDVRSDLTPGTTKFKCTYRAGTAGNTAIFGNRFIAVWPLS